MSHKLRFLLLLSLLFILTCVVPAQQVKLKCGTERWPVKTGTDPDTSKIDFHPQTVTINDLQQINNGQPFSQAVLKQHQSDRMNQTETTTFTLRATLIAYKVEAGATGDSDFHLVLQDESCQGGKANCTVVAEIPLPGCVAFSSKESKTKKAIRQQITQARTAFSQFVQQDKPANVDITQKFRVTSVPVEVTGIGFFDFDHGQRGRAPNIIEIHPVLKIRFLSQ